MKPRKVWPPETVEILKQHLAAGLSYGKIAKVMGRSRGGVATAIRTYIKGDEDKRDRRGADRLRWQIRRLQKGVRARQSNMWTEEALTEPYVVRKLRKQIEASR